jgi:hypothetical protein
MLVSNYDPTDPNQFRAVASGALPLSAVLRTDTARLKEIAMTIAAPADKPSLFDAVHRGALPLSSVLKIDDDAGELRAGTARLSLGAIEALLTPTLPGYWYRTEKVDWCVTVRCATDEAIASDVYDAADAIGRRRLVAAKPAPGFGPAAFARAFANVTGEVFVVQDGLSQRHAAQAARKLFGRVFGGPCQEDPLGQRVPMVQLEPAPVLSADQAAMRMFRGRILEAVRHAARSPSHEREAEAVALLESGAPLPKVGAPSAAEGDGPRRGIPVEGALAAAMNEELAIESPKVWGVRHSPMADARPVSEGGAGYGKPVFEGVMHARAVTRAYGDDIAARASPAAVTRALAVHMGKDETLRTQWHLAMVGEFVAQGAPKDSAHAAAVAIMRRHFDIDTSGVKAPEPEEQKCTQPTPNTSAS